MAGTLKGLKVVELAGLGPAPFCCMLLADHGADVLRITRPGAGEEVDPADVTSRGRRTVALDLGQPEGVEAALALIGRADLLVEGFRPGVMERLGLGPDECFARQPRLVYGRMTGWGQYGPLAEAAGYDINHIALSGALHAMGRAGDAPAPPMNLVGDVGGGMLLAFGLMAALHEARESGQGQVIDAATTDTAALLSSTMYGLVAAGRWTSERGENLLDGGAPFYDTYACADGKFVAVGALRPQNYRELLARCGIEEPLFDKQMDAARWPLVKLRLADLFRTRTRAAWCALLEGTDAGFAPVLDWDEAPAHPHNVARQAFVSLQGVVQPAPAPRFSRTPADVPLPQGVVSLGEALAGWGVEAAEVAQTADVPA